MLRALIQVEALLFSFVKVLFCLTLRVAPVRRVRVS